MHKILDLLIKYLGLPILERLGRFLYQKVSDFLEERRLKKAQKAKERAVENAKDPEDIRAAHRNNKL